MKKIATFFIAMIVMLSATNCGQMTQEQQEAKMRDDQDKNFVRDFSNFDFNSVTWGEKSDEFINDAFLTQTGCYYGTYERGSYKYTALCLTPDVLSKLGYTATEEEAWWMSAQLTDWAENMQKVDLSTNYSYNYETAWSRIHSNKYIDLSKETHSLPKLDTIWVAFENTQEETDDISQSIDENTDNPTPVAEESTSSEVENTQKTGKKILTDYGYVFWQNISDTDVLIFSDDRIDITVTSVEQKEPEYMGDAAFVVHGKISNHSGEDYQNIALNFTVLKDEKVIDDMQAGFCSVCGYNDYFLNGQEREFSCDLLVSDYSAQNGNEIGLTSVTTFGY